MEGKLAGPYEGTTDGVVKRDDHVICLAEDTSGSTAELIASALNLWELGAEDDTLDQLTAAHQMNLALSKQCAALKQQVEDLKNRLPTDDREDYGDNLIETANALLTKAGKAGSYQLSTFDSARISNVTARRTREQRSGEDVVRVSCEISLRKKCIKSGEYGDTDPFRGSIF